MKISDEKFLRSHGINIDLNLLQGGSKSTGTKLLNLLREKINETISEMEKSAKEFKKLGEDGLTATIVQSLNLTPYFTATREESSKGHVDITIKAPTFIPGYTFTYLGEAKIWKGVKYSLQGFDQLNQYATGRCLNQFTITYFRVKNGDSLFAKFRTSLATNRSCEILPESTNRYFQTKHTHNSGTFIETDHYSANMYSSILET